MTVWIVGKVTNRETMAWELEGVFSTEEIAVSHAITANCFVGPWKVDDASLVGKPSVEWPEAYYPHERR